MTEFEPLLQTSTDEAELAMLRSLDAEEPSAAALAKTAAALGLGTAGLTAAGSASAASAVGGLAKISIWGPVLKALAIGATSGLVVSAAVPGVFSEPGREPERPAVQAPAVAARPASGTVPASPARAEVSEAPSRAAEPTAPNAPPPAAQAGFVPGAAATPPANTSTARTVDEPALSMPLAQPESHAAPPAARATFAPVAAAAPPPAVRSVATAPTPAATASAAPEIGKHAPAKSIAEEVALMDRARRALSSGRASEALSELERYQARRPRGVFASEVLVLRVEAKLKLGDRAGAVREARALIDARPNSRYAARLRVLIENTK